MDWSNMLAALGNGARPGSALMAGFQQPQSGYTQQPVPPMSQPMYSNALAQPAQPDAAAVAATQAGATPPQMPQQQGHGVFSNLVKMFAGG